MQIELRPATKGSRNDGRALMHALRMAVTAKMLFLLMPVLVLKKLVGLIKPNHGEA
jgi:hypothetical protein